jgi:hypothetical protein
VDSDRFPWRPLGTLLVERGLLASAQLDHALAEQRRTGRLLGQILVERGYLTNISLARALADQHGVELRPAVREDEPAPRSVASAERPARTWRPLGRVLVEGGYVTEQQLERALAEQREQPGRRLGEVLVDGGYLSGIDLAGALAEQHGLELDSTDRAELRADTVVRPVAPGEPVYRVVRVTFEVGGARRSPVCETTNFLDAADAAFELVERESPEAVEIDKTDGRTTETVWAYSESRAAAASSQQPKLVETFGFDPTRWDVR